MADHRVDPTANNNEAIRAACDRNHVEIVRMLLTDSRVDPSTNNNEAIERAILHGYTELVQLLSDGRVGTYTS